MDFLFSPSESYLCSIMISKENYFFFKTRTFIINERRVKLYTWILYAHNLFVCLFWDKVFLPPRLNWNLKLLCLNHHSAGTRAVPPHLAQLFYRRCYSQQNITVPHGCYLTPPKLSQRKYMNQSEQYERLYNFLPCFLVLMSYKNPNGIRIYRQPGTLELLAGGWFQVMDSQDAISMMV